MNAIAMTDSVVLLAKHCTYCDKVLSGVDASALDEEQQWHLRRKLGLGGSEAGTILGLNKYQTAWDLWAIKTGRMDPPDLSDNMAVKMGHKLEQTVAELYCELTGYTVRRSNVHHIHKEKPWLVGNLDRVVVGEKRGLECKTASGFAAKKGGFGSGNIYGPNGELVSECDQVPDTYLVQVQHYMAVTGLPVFDLAVLIDGRQFRVFTIHRNDDLIAELESQLTAFWFSNVIDDIAPDGAPAAIEESVSGTSITATPDVEEMVSVLHEVRDAIDDLSGEKARIEEQIKAFMGEAEALTDHNSKPVITFKTSQRTALDGSALKKANPALWQQFAKTTTTRTFKVI